MKSLNESIREVEVKKRTLEETVDSLNEEITQRKAAEQMHKVNNTAQFFTKAFIISGITCIY
jgi:hypothetical protein